MRPFGACALAVIVLGGCGDNIGASVPQADAAATDAEVGDAAPDGAGAPPCTAGSVEELVACVDATRYAADLGFIAAERSPGTAHWQEVQDLCAERLAGLGFTVERQRYATGVNVIGVRTGVSKPGEHVVVSAHYDSTVGCPGADDNATGVAGVLEVARVLAAGSFARTTVVACWDEEEINLDGSAAYADRARAAGDTVIVAFVAEMLGYRSSEPNSQTVPPGLEVLFPDQNQQLVDNQYRADFVALIHDEASGPAVASMTTWAQTVALPTLELGVPAGLEKSDLIADLRRSDHDSFWQVDYPAIQITDTSQFRYAAYHCGNGLSDVVANLDNDFAVKIVRATVGGAAEALELQ